VFLNFYNLREQPFGATPDPRYLYFSPGHREALASLFYGIETGRGFLSLIAPPGMGKTTLLFQLLQRWKGYVHSAFLFQTQCDSRELIRYLLHDLGLNTDGEDIVKMHSELNQFLFRETLAGKRIVVFIDEAQNLTNEVLETVRLLSDFEATDRKLLQIVLAGQPELAQRLDHPGMEQLRQRIAVQARLEPLPSSQIVPYISHRLQAAGYDGPELFTPGALALIAERSSGIPRLVNHICFNSLSTGCALGKRQITSDIAREAAADLFPVSKTHERSSALPQTMRTAAPIINSPVRSPRAWISLGFLRRRLLPLSAICLAVGGLGVYAAIQAGARRAVSSTPIGSGAVHSTRTPEPAAMTHPESVQQPYSQELQDISQMGGESSQKGYFTYVVQPKDTLRDLCLSSIGHYDRAVLHAIQKLNPQLTDPDVIQSGQEIRLPLDPLGLGSQSKSNGPADASGRAVD
jgi:type II secretory pathway predicted ATPase ExeA